MPNLLIIAPHPDDEAIASGGLIARSVRCGWNVFALVGTIGECRQLVTGSTDSYKRIKEFKEAQEVGGYSGGIMFIGADFMKLDVRPRKDICDKIEDVVEATKPDIVVIPPASSYDQDHRALAEAAITAFRPRPASLKHSPELILEADEPYWWRVNGQRPTPNYFVVLSKSDLDKKIEIIKANASQDRKDPFGRSIENIERCARSYGVEIGEEFAEAYRVLRMKKTRF